MMKEMATDAKPTPDGRHKNTLSCSLKTFYVIKSGQTEQERVPFKRGQTMAKAWTGPLRVN